MNEFLAIPIENLKGQGPKRSDLLKTELRIFNYGDLLYYFPYKYIDRSTFYNVVDLHPDLPMVQIKGTIIRKQLLGIKQSQRLVVLLRDATGTIELIWFKGIKYMEQQLLESHDYVAFGRINDYKGKLTISHPEMELYTPTYQSQMKPLQAAYNTTGKMKERLFDSKQLSKAIKTLTDYIQASNTILPEILPAYISQKYKFIDNTQALLQLHAPSESTTLQNAQNRIKYEEFFLLQVKLLKQKKVNTENTPGHIFEKVGDYYNQFYNNVLPFELTNAQKRVLKEIRSDTKSGKHMNRLIQGDVGSGKTIVALMNMILANDNNFQACLMAPTEILANQHFQSITDLLKNMSIQCALLTGSTKTKARKQIHEQLLSGELHILIGTHALLEDVVQFKNLGLAIIDEQHRFGVEQRYKLWKKHSVTPPHILVMTATPIPRTLAMTLYGDLDISVIDELPAGRKPIKTVHFLEQSRLKAYGLIRDEIAKGRQIYVVYPLIEESEKLDFQNLMDGFDNIISYFPAPTYRVSVVHGQMTAADKNAEMQAFVNGQTHIMLATTVIEVGVNVPNATVMVIESTERFGLSQLHQLRGRVGRGAEQSHCILISGNKLGADTRVRIQTMCETNDGFKISEVDLKLRGPGDIQGTQQSGVLDFKLADIVKDAKILAAARNDASEIINIDPNFNLPEHRELKNYFEQMLSKKINWNKVS